MGADALEDLLGRGKIDVAFSADGDLDNRLHALPL